MEWNTIQGVIGWVISKSVEDAHVQAQGWFEIMSMITPWFVRLEVWLPIFINHINNKVWEKLFLVM